MTSAQVIVQPDLEAHVWSVIGGPGVTSFCYAATHDFPDWLVAWSLQVDCRAKTKELAAALAEQTRQRMTTVLPAAPWEDGVVSYAQCIDGPFWLADPEDGGPRYVARYEVRAHPRPAGPPAPVAGTRASRPRRRK
jgi:hypothetical protein